MLAETQQPMETAGSPFFYTPKSFDPFSGCQRTLTSLAVPINNGPPLRADLRCL